MEGPNGKTIPVIPDKWVIKNVAAPPGEQEPCFEAIDSDGDGNPDNLDDYDDLTIYFYVQGNDGVVRILGTPADGDVITLKLKGNLLNGTPIKGEDVIIVLKKGKAAPGLIRGVSATWGAIKSSH